jgi:CubicO group peptidase (beta-lactamase class C family)
MLLAVAKAVRLCAQVLEESRMSCRGIARAVFFLTVSLACVGIDARANGPDRRTAAVDEIFSDLTKPGSPGCALAVARNGKILYESGYGLANIEENVRITPQTVFDIGSTSKQFTASSILLLAKQGKLSLNDDIRKYIPELPGYGGKITILHLLNHTSGLRDYLTLFELAGVNVDSVTTDDDALALIARQKALNFDPGSDWLYSNTGFFLLSVIVKRVSGKTLREFAAENIFSPLGMTHTLYRDDHALLVPGRALAYEPKDGGDGFSLDVSYFEQTGDGAVHTSVEDLLKWDANFYSPKVGGSDFLAELQEPGKLSSGKTLDYAKGLFLQDYRGLRTVSHAGSWGGYRAQLLRFPDQHFSVVCLCNLGSANPDRRAHRVAAIYLADVMKPEQKASARSDARPKKPSVPVSPAQLSAYAGSYWSDELGVFYVLAAGNGALYWKKILGAEALPRTQPDKELRPVGPDEFIVDSGQLQFHFQQSPEGSPTGFSLDAGRTLGIRFIRKALPASASFGYQAQ